MKLKLITILFLFLLIGCNKPQHKSEGSLIIKDDLNNAFSLSEIPQKVISLAPNLTEIIYFVGGERYLKGVTTYCKFPPEAKKKEKIGDLITVDYEKILKIKPDLIFMTIEGNTKAQYGKLKSLGFKVFVTNPRSFKGIENSILTIGKILGNEKTAAAKVDSINSELKRLGGNMPTLRDSALFLISVQPLMAANKNTFIGEYLSFFGIKNTIRNSSQSYPVINIETLIKENPSMIILPEKMFPQLEEIINNNPILKRVSGIKNNRIIRINPDLYFKPGPRFAEALTDLKNKIGK